MAVVIAVVPADVAAAEVCTGIFKRYPNFVASSSRRPTCKLPCFVFALVAFELPLLQEQHHQQQLNNKSSSNDNDNNSNDNSSINDDDRN